MHVEVIYALPERQHLIHLELDPPATVGDALHAVARLAPFNQLALERMPCGVFGHLVERDRQLRAGDRVELYRPLETDPKQARRQRAAR